MNKYKIKSLIVALTLIYGFSNVQLISAVELNKSENEIQDTKSIEPSTQVDIIEVGTVDKFIETIELNSSANIKLTNDLNLFHHMTGSTIITEDFSGVIDGNGYAIRNVTKPIFNNIIDGEIKNLILDEVHVSNQMGIISNNATNLTLSNVHIMNSSINANHTRGTGGLAGVFNSGNIDNVSMTNTLIKSGQRVGGFIGRARGDINISNIYIDADVTSTNSASSGFVGENGANISVDKSIIIPTFNSNGTVTRGGVIGYGRGKVLNMTNSFVGVSTSSPSINHILGSGSSKGSIYEWSGSEMISQSFADWIFPVDSDDVNNNFFNNTLQLDYNVWNVGENVNIDNMPKLTSYETLNNAYLERISFGELSFKRVEEYDKLIKENYSLELTSDYEMLLLQRDLVKNVGYKNLVSFATYNEDYSKFINWFINDYEALKAYTIGGKPDGAYVNSLNILYQLYNVYSEDLSATGVTANGIEYKDLYLRMMMTTALTHSATVGFWAGGRTDDPRDPNTSDAVTRYGIYKDLFNDGLLESYFDTLEIEEMRFVMNNIIDDESIKWINWYTRNYESNNPRNPYTYIQYGSGWNYLDEQYYTEENYAKWDEKYNLSEFGISYKAGFPKPWVVFEEDGVCGAVSKTGSNIAGGYGQPSSVVSQPGHAAYILYNVNDDGNAYWQVWNNISGWQQSGKTEKLNSRMPNGWGSGTYASRYPASYVLLAQGALNNFDRYEEAEMILLLEDTYKNDSTKLEEIYRKALEKNNINFDAWLGLVDLYLADSDKNDIKLLELATEIGENLKYYPLPMYDLLRKIETGLTTSGGNFSYTRLLNEYLTAGTVATANDSIQYRDVISVAKYLLGVEDLTVANFSFDGENAGEIVLSDRFDGTNTRWDYSLDGGQTWVETELKNHKLTEGELENITSENDLLVHIVGQNYNQENIYTIDITESEAPEGLYNNDLENKVIGVEEFTQWYNEETASWVYFRDEEPNLSGDKLIKIRNGATGTIKASSEIEFTFTESIQSLNRKYVSISNMELNSISSEETRYEYDGIHAIDGNMNTSWFTNISGHDQERYIVIELNNPIKLSAIEYYPYQLNGYGIIKDVEVLVSMDGVNFEVAGSAQGWANNIDMKSVELENSVEAKYIKIHATAYNGGKSFVGAKMFNIFEDTTVVEEVLEESENINKAEVLEENEVTKEVNGSEEVKATESINSDVEITE